VRRAGLSAPELAWERALELAPAEEIEELDRLEALSHTLEPGTWAMLEPLQGMRELKERIMYRSSPPLAVIYRAQRCLLLCGLVTLVEEEGAIEAFEARNTRRPTGSPEADAAGADAAVALVEECDRLKRRRDGLSRARTDREQVVLSGAEPVTDVEEAFRLVQEVFEAVDAGDLERVFRLVGRR
jgi:hypothetical protein